LINGLVIICGGLPSSYIGGWLSDKYEAKYPKIKGQLSGLGALAAVPFILVTYSL
jgi:hypothetical protein